MSIIQHMSFMSNKHHSYIYQSILTCGVTVAPDATSGVIEAPVAWDTGGTVPTPHILYAHTAPVHCIAQ